jgi:hypothetical protein
MTAISLSLRTLFADLAQRVETASPSGSVYRRTLKGIEFLYAKVPVGNTRLDLFLGKVGDTDAEARVVELERGTVMASDRRKTVSLLKSAGLSGPDRILGATLDTIAYHGLFRRGAVVVGAGAYLMSEALIGRTLSRATLMTGDLDIAVSDLTLAAEPPDNFEQILQRADPTFAGIMQLDARKASSRFKTTSGFLVDLVTPTIRRSDENPMPIARLRAGAAPLQHLAWLIENPVPTVALWGAGIAVRVPQPARYAVHKLILPHKRFAGGRDKRGKDLAQASALIDALEQEDPFALQDALADARSRGARGWAEPIARSLQEIGRTDLLDQAAMRSCQSSTVR